MKKEYEILNKIYKEIHAIEDMIQKNTGKNIILGDEIRIIIMVILSNIYTLEEKLKNNEKNN